MFSRQPDSGGGLWWNGWLWLSSCFGYKKNTSNDASRAQLYLITSEQGTAETGEMAFNERKVFESVTVEAELSEWLQSLSRKSETHNELVEIFKLYDVRAPIKNGGFTKLSGYLGAMKRVEEELQKRFLMNEQEGFERNRAGNSQQADEPDRQNEHSDRKVEVEYLDIDEYIWHYLLFSETELTKLLEDLGVVDGLHWKFCKNNDGKEQLQVSHPDRAILNKICDALADICQDFVCKQNVVEKEVAVVTKADVDLMKAKLGKRGVLLLPPSPYRLIGPSDAVDSMHDKFMHLLSSCRPIPSDVGLESSDSHLDLFMFETPSGCTVHVHQGDLVNQHTDAIVNPANVYLAHGSGAAGAIAEAAGRVMIDECQRYIQKYKRLDTSVVMHTSAGNLPPPIRFIIHCAGPDARNIKDNEKCFSLLRDSFKNCFIYANDQLEISSIAVPAISSGIYGVKKTVVAQAAYEGLMDFEKIVHSRKPTNRSLRHIHFVNIDSATTKVMANVFRECYDKKCMLQDFAICYSDDTSSGVKNGQSKNGVSTMDTSKRAASPDTAFVYSNGAYQRHTSNQESFPDEFPNSPGGSYNLNHRTDGGKQNSHDQTLKETLDDRAEDDNGIENPMAVRSLSHPGTTDDEADGSGSGNGVHESKHSYADVLKGTNCEHPDSCDSDSVPHTDNSVKASETMEYNLNLHDFEDNKSTNQPAKSETCATHRPHKRALKPKEGSDASTFTEADKKSQDDNVCVICLEKITDPMKLDCDHIFCRGCIVEYFEKYQTKCPSCGRLFGVLKGNQPPGKFSTRILKSSLAGYGRHKTIEITYTFPDGRQTEDHPNPGRWYKGTTRTAYLPDCDEGREVCKLLECAFKAGLVFTIGRSVTTGHEGVIVWNDIHHKTKPDGSYGYPDPTYLQRVKEELASKGIFPASSPSGDSNRTVPSQHGTAQGRPTSPTSVDVVDDRPGSPAFNSAAQGRPSSAGDSVTPPREASSPSSTGADDAKDLSTGDTDTFTAPKRKKGRNKKPKESLRTVL